MSAVVFTVPITSISARLNLLYPMLYKCLSQNWPVFVVFIHLLLTKSWVLNYSNSWRKIMRWSSKMPIIRSRQNSAFCLAATMHFSLHWEKWWIFPASQKENKMCVYDRFQQNVKSLFQFIFFYLIDNFSLDTTVIFYKKLFAHIICNIK